MDILFLNPPFIGRFSRTSRSPAVAKGGTLYYPIWLAYAAGVAEADGHGVRLVDAPAEGLDLDAALDRLGGLTPGLAVVDTSTPSILSDASVAARIKARFPGAMIVLVGTHPSALPEETLALDTALDAVALGEYDHTIRDLARALEASTPLEDVAGLALRREGRVIRTPERPRIEDLDYIPFVSSVYRRHLRPRSYFFAAANYPMVQIMTGRGCPFRCFFCVYPQVFHSRRYRTRSPENVVTEFEYIREHLPEVREVGIEDDCFTANPRHVRRICELLIERRVGLKWYCNVRGDVAPDLLRLMRRAGCRLVTVGFESGCQEILDAMRKGETLERYRAFARDARDAGLLVHGCLMAGNPGDTEETLARSFRFALEIDCDSMQFYPLYVYPGTEAYDWARSMGYLTTTDFSRWVDAEGLHNCVLSTPDLTAERLVELCDEHLRRYHLRPRYILRKLLQGLRDPGEGYRTLKSARVFLTKVLLGGTRRERRC